MSEEDRQRSSSPLESGRGRTRIKDGVVSKIAGVAAREVEGIFMGGSAAGGVLGSVTGSRGKTQGISVEVGRTEAAIDVTMGIEYGGNILQLAERVRRDVSERVEELTGLRVTELNVTVSDVIFPEGEESGISARRTEEIDTGDREREAEESVDLGAARAEAITRSGSRFSEETIRAEDPPPQEDETVELSLDDEDTRRREE